MNRRSKTPLITSTPLLSDLPKGGSNESQPFVETTVQEQRAGDVPCSQQRDADPIVLAGASTNTFFVTMNGIEVLLQGGEARTHGVETHVRCP